MPRYRQHPEAAQARLASQAAERAATKPLKANGWHWAFGFKILFWDHGGNFHRVDTPASATYAEAVSLRDQQMATGHYVKAWLIMKTGEET